MPKIPEFLGIAIYMYYRDHNPAHFHARYGEEEVQIAVEDLSILRGSVSPRAMGLVTEWASLHQDDLMRVWSQAREHRHLDQIEPLR